MSTVVSCLGVREQWFTRGNYFVSFCVVHHAALSGFPWLLLHPRWVTSSPQTTNDSQAIGDCPLLSKQYFSSVSQNPSLVLLIEFLQLLSPFYPQGRLSPLFCCLCCSTCMAWSSWKSIGLPGRWSHLILSFQAFVYSFLPCGCSLTASGLQIPWHRFCPFQKASPLWVQLGTYFACAITAVSTQNIEMVFGMCSCYTHCP